MLRLLRRKPSDGVWIISVQNSRSFRANRKELRRDTGYGYGFTGVVIIKVTVFGGMSYQLGHKKFDVPNMMMSFAQNHRYVGNLWSRL